MSEREFDRKPEIPVSQVRVLSCGDYVNGNYTVKVYPNLLIAREFLNPDDKELRPEFADIITFHLRNDDICCYNEIFDSIPSHVVVVLNVWDFELIDYNSGLYSILKKLYEKKVHVILEVNETCFGSHFNLFEAWEGRGLFQEIRVQIIQNKIGLIESVRKLKNAVVDITLGFSRLNRISYWICSGVRCYFRGYIWVEHLQGKVQVAESDVEENLRLTRMFFPDMLKCEVNLSFDWLALDQLNLLGRGFNGLDDFYKEFWLTNLYVDLSRGVYAYNKISDELEIQEHMSVVDMFQVLQRHFKSKSYEAPIGGYAERTEYCGYCPKCKRLAHMTSDLWLAEDKPNRVSRECWCDCGEKWFENYKWVKGEGSDD